MKSAVETLSPTRVKLTIEVPFEELQPSIDAALTAIGRQINVPGFRNGKVPAKVIEQRVGRDAVLGEAVNEALPRVYNEALKEHSVIAVGQPEVDVEEIKDGEPLSFTAEVDVRPEFDLPDFSTIEVVVDDAEPTEEEVDVQVDALRERFANLNTVERAGADGDVLLVDIAGATDAGDAIEELTGNALSYELGTDGMLPGFDDAVRGASAGETRTFIFTPSNGDWTGVPLTITVNVSAVRERILPAFDDDFAQLASEFDTAEELRADVRTRMSRVKQFEQGAQARGKVHEALVASVDFPLPENMIEAEVEAHFSDGHGADDPDHRKEFEENTRMSMKSSFILDKIADRDEIGVSEAELSQWLMQQAPQYGMSPDDFAKALVEAGQVPVAMAEIRRVKALASVLETVSIKDESGRPVDLNALNEMMAALNAMGGMG